MSQSTIARTAPSGESLGMNLNELPIAEVHPIAPARAPTLHEWFEAMVGLSPEAVALIEPGDDLTHPLHITYAELNRRANQLAHYLIERGVGPEVLVAVFLRRSTEMIVALLGILKSGGAYLPLDPVYPRERLEHIVGDADARLVITQQTLSNQLPEARSECLFIDTQWEDIARHSQQNPEARSSESNLAYVIYTSGSTGRPKGTEVVHRNVIRLLQGTGCWFHFNKSDTWTFFHSLAFDFSVWEIWGALLHGGRLVIVSFEASRTPAIFRELLKVCRVTVLNQTPSAFRQLIQWEEEFGSAADLSLKWVIFGGEVLDLKMLLPWVERHGDENPRLINMYGITETTVHVTYRRIHRHDLESGKSLIGKPIPGWQVYVLDDSARPAPIGVIGEIYVGGEGVARGYLRRPELTLARFLPDPFGSNSSARIYRSGDLGRYLASGDLEYLGRSDNQVKIRGYRIELGEITSELLGLDGIGQCAVIDRRRETHLVELVAYLVPSPGKTIHLEFVRSALENKLPDYMVPSGWVVLDSLPLTPNGKLDRKALPAPQREPLKYEPPRTPKEADVCRIFAAILGLETVGRTDHFFRLGGNSLLAVRLIGRLKSTLGGEPTVRLIFEAPTPAELARRINQAGVSVERIRRQPRREFVPLSLNQGDLWLVDQMKDGSPEYNLLRFLGLTGPLDITALKRALHALVCRHEILRTRFESGESEPVQIADREPLESLQMVDLGPLSMEEFNSEVSRVAEREGMVPFDLNRGPLIRFLLFKGPENYHILLRISHHIVSDGWSEGVLDSELAALYISCRDGSPSTLPELPIQYADFSLWQRTKLTPEWFSKRLPLWGQYLTDISFHLDLSTIRLRSPDLGRTLGEFTHRWGAKQVSELISVGEAKNATLFSVLLTLFAEVLSHHSGQDRFVIGTPTAGRILPELEPLVGFFVNMLPIGIRLRSDVSFVEQVENIQDSVLWAMEHQEISLALIAETLAEVRSPGASPLFQVVFALQNTPISEINIPGMIWSQWGKPASFARFDLELHVHENEGELEFQWLYCRELFDHQRIGQLANHFVRLADKVVAHPRRKLAQYALLEPTEQEYLLQLSNPPPQESIAATVVELFEEQVRSTPGATALVDGDRAVSYEQLNQMANELAYRLIQEGVCPGTVVGIWAVRGAELIIGLLGILKSGGAYLPLDPATPSARLQAIIAQAQPRIILKQRIPGQDYPDSGLAEIEFPSSTTFSLEDGNPTRADRLGAVTCETAAYVVFTSGSTGTPKGVVVPHRGIVRLVRAPNYMRLDSTVRMLQLAPVSFDAATLEIWGPLLNGGTVVLAPSGLLSLAEISRCLLSNRVNSLFLTTGLFHALVDEDLFSFKGLMQFLTGGEVISPSHVSRFREAHPHCTFIHAYGPTEITTFATCETLPENIDGIRPVPIGRPINETTVLILDGALNLVPVGMRGEIYLAGAGLAIGYSGASALTAERFVANPFSPLPGGRMYRTGDLGRWHPNGTLEFLGREDHQIKIRGFRIELAEIEIELRKLPGIHQTAVIALTNEATVVQLVAYIVPSDGPQIDPQAIRASLARNLPDYMIPSGWVVMDSLPLTPNGKLDRRALPMPKREARPTESPQNSDEDIICRLFGTILGLESVGRNDHFFRSGGDSLQAMRLLGQLRRQQKLDIPFSVLFESPTPQALALKLAGANLEARDLVPRNNAEPTPLSHAQEGLWFVDHFQGGSREYNIPWSIRISGPLNIPILESSLQALLDRHESLRTRIEQGDGAPIQIVEPRIALRIHIMDWSNHPSEKIDSLQKSFFEREREAVFDLQNPSFIRFTLIHLGPENHIFTRTTHHIISDGWSELILDSEISRLYSAFVRGQSNPLPPLPIQFPDYCHWKRQRLTSSVIQDLLSYWKPQLAGIPPEVTLPMDRPRPEAGMHAFDHVRIQLSPSEKKELKNLGTNSGGTLYTTLLGAFSLLIAHYSGEQDIPIGTAVSGRDDPLLEPIVGFLVNTLVIRVKTAGISCFSELIRATQSVVLGALDHQDLPFQKLVEAVQPDRKTNANPLFQLFFSLESKDVGQNSFGDCTIEPLGNRETLVRFDLELHATESPLGLALDFLYNQGLFDRWRIEQFSRHFVALLGLACRQPNCPLAALTFLSPEDRRTLIHDFNGTHRELRGETVVDRVGFHVQRNPEGIAIQADDESLSYAALDQQSGQLARMLISRGVRKGDAVAVSLSRSPQLIIALMAVWKVGAVYLPLDPSYPNSRLLAIVQEAVPTQLILASGNSSLLAPQRTVFIDAPEVRSALLATTVGQGREKERLSSLFPGDPAYIIYTSGTTGRPKGIVVPHRTLLNLVEWHESRYLPGPVAQSTSVSFDVSLQEITEALLRGQTLVIIGDVDRADAARFAAKIQRYGIAHLFAPQILLEHLIEGALDTGIELPSLRGLYQAGEPLRITSKMRSFFELHRDCQLHNHYGPAESHVVTGLTLTDSPGSWASTPTIGRPIWNTSVFILNPDLAMVPLGSIGEIYLAGIGLAHGYLNQPGRTAERFVANPFSEMLGDRMYRTGDLGRWRPDGTVEFLGRSDFQVKIRGFRIELGEIEHVLNQHAGVRQAVVISRHDFRRETYLAAYLVLEEQVELDVDGLNRAVARQLPDYMIPAAWVQLPRLPLTVNGKLDRLALPVPQLESRQVETPQTPEEETVCGIFATVLGLNTVRRNDHFFRLGGHSLLAMRLVNQLGRAFGGEPTVRVIFESPTPAELAQRLGIKKAGVTAIPRDPRSGTIPLSLNQRNLWLLDQLEDGSPEYNVPYVLDMSGPLNRDALERALHALVARHEILRTRFEPNELEPVQIIEPDAIVALQVVNIREVCLEEFQAEASHVVEREGAVPFNLRTGPLVRFILLCGPQDRNLLLRISHHIVTDGWSETILNSELAALYTAFTDGSVNPLSEIGIQYADFSSWQRKKLSPEWFANRLPLWREFLSDIPQQLAIPTDEIRSDKIAKTGGKLVRHWSSKQLTELKSLAAAENVTLFSALLTLYAEVLSRHAGQDRFIIGSPTAGRLLTELESLVGFFVNMLPIAVRQKADASFVEQVAVMQQSVLWAIEQQEFPLAKLVETFSDVRQPGVSPLFQVVFALQDEPLTEWNVAGNTWHTREFATPLVRFDLEVHAYEKGDEFQIQWLYRRELFHQVRIAQFADHFDRLARKVCASPQLPMSQHSLLGPIEVAHLLQLSQPATEESNTSTVVDLFEAQVHRTPDSIALTDAHTSLSYQQLDIAANQLAHRLLQEGALPGMVIGVWAVRRWELIVGLLGILKSGCAYLPLDPSSPLERIRASLNQAHARLVLHPRIPGPDYPDSGLTKIEFSISTDSSLGGTHPTHASRPGTITSQSAAYVVFTSGSTGTPKGVVTPHGAIVRLVRVPNYMRLDASVRMLQMAPVSFDAATLEIWGPLLNGGTVVLAPPGLLSLSEISRSLRTSRINTLWLTSGLFHAMVDAELGSMGGLTQLLAGGDVLSPEHVHKFRAAHPQCRLINGYGPTEITTFATCHTVPVSNDADRPVPIGRPINETTVLVLDRGLNLVPIGMSGEIYLGGTGLAIGYSGASALTAERFVSNPYSPIPGARMYRTGDLGRWRPDGALEFLGRSDHQIKIRGFRIELGEIEIALRQLAGVGQAAVIANTSETASVQLVAYVVPAQGTKTELGTIQTELGRKLPDYMIPTGWVVLDSLPLTPNGKLDRRALPLPQLEPKETEAAQNRDEEELCRIFASVLGVQKVGRRDHFFQIGGHSLQAVRLVAAIQKALGVELPVRSVLLHPTVAELAAELTVARGRKSDQESNLATLSTVWFDALPWSLEDWPIDLPVTGKSFPNIPLEEWTIHHNSVSGRLYVDYLRQFSPEKPLLIGGYCRVGLIAFEAACQLTEAGRAPAGIILVDTTPPSWLVRSGRAISVRIGRALGASPSQIALKAYGLLRFLTLVEDYWTIPGIQLRARWKEVTAVAAKWPLFATASKTQPKGQQARVRKQEEQILYANDYWQLSDFRIRKFEGPVLLLFSQETPLPIRRHIARRWAKYCPNLIVDETPGDHESCVREDAGGLARKIAEHARKITVSKEK